MADPAASRRDEIEHFDALVSEFMARNPASTRAHAIARVAHKHPAAHQRYLKASNPKAAWGE
jgi:hypothetical protein